MAPEEHTGPFEDEDRQHEQSKGCEHDNVQLWKLGELTAKAKVHSLWFEQRALKQDEEGDCHMGCYASSHEGPCSVCYGPGELGRGRVRPEEEQLFVPVAHKGAEGKEEIEEGNARSKSEADE